MKRKAMEYLIKWKNKENRKPLLLYGARQVGKTYLLKEFGSKEFENTIYVNFETNQIVSDLINENIDPYYIIKKLEVVFNQKIDKNKTLIIFDEIQNNSRALTSLKYFCEDAREYHIVGAGSLLGVSIKRENYSFPVGKVDSLTIFPLSFDEFLINTNNELLSKEIERCYKNNMKISKVLHEKAMELYYDYLVTGGMPEVVLEYINTNSLLSAFDVQSKIIDTYRNETSKYADSSLANRIIASFNSIPNQLAKDNKKFQYKVVQKGGTSTIFGESIAWLENAGIVIKCVKTKIGLPLKMYEEIDSFKLYMNDVGLLTNLSKMPIFLIKDNPNLDVSVFGMITENYVASSFKYNNLNLNYWVNSGTSEVDFVLQSKKGLIIPIEVKSGNHVKARSLNNYIEEYKPKYAIRISGKNFGFQNNIKSVPLYAVFCITEDSLDI